MLADLGFFVIDDLGFFVIDDLGFFFVIDRKISVVMFLFLLRLRCFFHSFSFVKSMVISECHVTNCRAGKPRGLSGQYFNVSSLMPFASSASSVSDVTAGTKMTRVFQNRD